MTFRTYIIVASSGEYEDAWSNPVVVGRDRAKLELRLKELEQERDHTNALYEQWFAYREEWFKNNPRPTNARNEVQLNWFKKFNAMNQEYLKNSGLPPEEHYKILSKNDTSYEIEEIEEII